jgi:hypothetical protein
MTLLDELLSERDYWIFLTANKIVHIAKGANDKVVESLIAENEQRMITALRHAGDKPFHGERNDIIISGPHADERKLREAVETIHGEGQRPSET